VLLNEVKNLDNILVDASFSIMILV
jgi:hypothetical protein